MVNLTQTYIWKTNFFSKPFYRRTIIYSYAGLVYVYIRVRCARSSNRVYIRYILYTKKKNKKIMSSKQNAATSTPPSSSWHWFIVIKRLLRVYTILYTYGMYLYYTRIIYFLLYITVATDKRLKLSHYFDGRGEQTTHVCTYFVSSVLSNMCSVAIVETI